MRNDIIPYWVRELFLVMPSALVRVFYAIVIVLYFPLSFIHLALKLSEQLLVMILQREYALSAEETLLVKDREECPCYCSGVLYFDDEISLEALHSLIMKRVITAKSENGSVLYPRLFKHVRPGLLNFFWTNDEKFELSNHVFAHTEYPQSEGEVMSLLTDLCDKPMPPDESPWQIILIHHSLQKGVRGTSLMFRAHHALLDGVSAAAFLQQKLCDGEVEMFKSKQTFASKKKTAAQVVKGVILLLRYSYDLVLGSYESPFSRSPLSGVARLGRSAPIDLDLLRKIKSKAASTINDVVVAAYVTTLRDILVRKGFDVRRKIQLMIPVNMRGYNVDMPVQVENNFILIPISFQFDSSDGLQTLYDTKTQMDAHKAASTHSIFAVLLKYISALSPVYTTEYLFDKLIFERCMALISNIPGPTNDIFVAGKKVTSMHFWAPYRFAFPISMTIISYNKKVYVGVKADAAINIDPNEIVTSFESNLEKLADELSIK